MAATVAEAEEVPEAPQFVVIVMLYSYAIMTSAREGSAQAYKPESHASNNLSQSSGFWI